MSDQKPNLQVENLKEIGWQALQADTEMLMNLIIITKENEFKLIEHFRTEMLIDCFYPEAEKKTPVSANTKILWLHWKKNQIKKVKPFVCKPLSTCQQL